MSCVCRSNKRVWRITVSGSGDVGPMKGTAANLACLFKCQLDKFNDKDTRTSRLRVLLHDRLTLKSYRIVSPKQELPNRVACVAFHELPTRVAF